MLEINTHFGANIRSAPEVLDAMLAANGSWTMDILNGIFYVLGAVVIFIRFLYAFLLPAGAHCRAAQAPKTALRTGPAVCIGHRPGLQRGNGYRELHHVDPAARATAGWN